MEMPNLDRPPLGLLAATFSIFLRAILGKDADRSTHHHLRALKTKQQFEYTHMQRVMINREQRSDMVEAS
jgi:hypothetical protein